MDPSLYCIKAIGILDNDGKRLISKFYDDSFPTAKEQMAFEKTLFNKTHKANAEIILLDGMICTYRTNVDLYFFVIGSASQNELILMSVLSCLYDSISQILRKNVEKRALIENMDIAFLAVDEICDNGVIMECEASNVVQRVALRAEDSISFNSDASIGSVGMQIFDTAKQQLKMFNK